MDRPPLYFILAGQSNMCGRAKGMDLDENLRTPYPDVKIVWNNDMNMNKPAISEGWQDLQPQYAPFIKATQFGPEISLGRRLQESLNRPIYLIKFAMGSTNLYANWNPDGQDVKIGRRICKNYYKDFIDFTTKWIADLKSKHPNAEFGGVFWMQGEGDAMDKKFANVYAQNLNQFFACLRKVFGYCPIITGLIKWPAKFQDKVNQAIQKVARENEQIFTVDTSDLISIGYTYDPEYNNSHFDAESLLKLGYQMAGTYLNEIL